MNRRFAIDYYISIKERENHFDLTHTFDDRDPVESTLPKRDVSRWVEEGMAFSAGASRGEERNIKFENPMEDIGSRARILGAEMYMKILAPNSVSGYFRDFNGSAGGPNIERVIGFRFEPHPLLHQVPWEIMHRSPKGLALSNAEIVRVPLIPGDGLRDGLQVDGEVRILITTANPACHPKLAILGEVSDIKVGLEQCGRENFVEVLQHANRDRLCQYFQEAQRKKRPYHIWLHSGHGSYEDGKFNLILESDTTFDSCELMAPHDLEALMADQSFLRLAFLNVCHGGSTRGLASALATLNIPAVLAHPSAVLDTDAMMFSKTLFKFLPEFSLIQALTKARIEASTASMTSNPQLFARFRGESNIWKRAKQKKLAAVRETEPGRYINIPKGLYVEKPNEFNLIFKTGGGNGRKK